jgi:RNA polymerase sigma-70 factor (ECF subfamily)
MIGRSYPRPDEEALTALARRAQNGDQTAATELVHHTYQQLWRAMVALSSRPEAEDLVQETYARAFRSLPGFRAESSVRTWLLSIARRVAADNLRMARTRPRTDPLLQEEDLPRPAHGELGEAVALRALVDRLHPDRRTAFLLTQVSGLSYEEAAEVCGCPIGTIRSRVARARADLLAALSGDSTAEGPAEPADAPRPRVRPA